jgi:predicted ArsR family transcriptional regulator
MLALYVKRPLALETMTEEPDRPDQSDRLGALSALAEPNRRALYEHVAAAGGWVSRDQAADAVGLERGTAAHHLDRLAADGLLETDYQRLSGRRGPGAGRPAKVYRRSQRELGVSLPPRDYGLAGRLLASAVDRSRTSDVDVTRALDDVARAEGRRLAEEVQARGRSAANRRTVVLEVLELHGFEPRTLDDGSILLANCPFHQLARDHTELICGMNLRLLDAAVESVGGTGLQARLEPEDGQCCVQLRVAR